jgi:hypothetical protein
MQMLEEKETQLRELLERLENGVERSEHVSIQSVSLKVRHNLD